MLHHFRKLISALSEGRYKEVVKKATQGDPRAFGKLYIHHIDAIYRFTFFRVNTKEDIEDLTQNIFYKAWENIAYFKGNEKQFRAWLFTIARNTIVDYYRSKKESMSLSFDVLDTKLSPDAQLVLKYFKTDFNKALGTLTPDQREVLLLKLVEGLGNIEIAKIMKRDEDAIRALQYRALKKLRKMLKHYEG